MAEAGTATSPRMRAEPNAFNVLRIERNQVTVEQVVWNHGGFGAVDIQTFVRTNDGWSVGPPAEH